MYLPSRSLSLHKLQKYVRCTLIFSTSPRCEPEHGFDHKIDSRGILTRLPIALVDGNACPRTFSIQNVPLEDISLANLAIVTPHADLSENIKDRFIQVVSIRLRRMPVRAIVTEFVRSLPGPEVLLGARKPELDVNTQRSLQRSSREMILRLDCDQGFPVIGDGAWGLPGMAAADECSWTAVSFWVSGHVDFDHFTLLNSTSNSQ